jgi:hypothetical protein
MYKVMWYFTIHLLYGGNGVLWAPEQKDDTDNVTVQVVKTGITPQLAPAERLWGVETVPLHPAGQLHTLR